MRCAALLVFAGLWGCRGAGALQPPSAAALAARADAIAAEHRLHVVPAPPAFVVVAGGQREEVEALAVDLVTWPSESLHRTLFDRYPTQVVAVWLFRSSESYASWAPTVIGHRPGSPYGVYAPCANALVVDRSRGDGTVVHELVHVLVEEEFPGAPTWLDEGLASLYESPATRDGRLVGEVNWRLPRLQQQLREGHEVIRDTLTGWFRFGDEALHYAVARFLLYDLQEQGLLERYYHALRDHGGDPVEQLEALVGEPLAHYEAAWRGRMLASSWR